MLNKTLLLIKIYLFLFVELSVFYYFQYICQKCTGKVLLSIFPISLYYKTYFVFKTISSIIQICKYSAFDMCNRYRHTYQINQEKRKKNHLLITFHYHEISDPLPVQSAISLECVGILKKKIWLAFTITFTYCTDTICISSEAQKQRSGSQKNRRIRLKPVNDPLFLGVCEGFVLSYFQRTTGLSRLRTFLNAFTVSILLWSSGLQFQSQTADGRK